MTQLPFEWATDRDGEYTAMMVPGVNGVHTVNVKAVVGSDTIRSTSGYVRVADPTAEFFGAEMRPAVLRQFAEETGGKFYRTFRGVAARARTLSTRRVGRRRCSGSTCGTCRSTFLLLLGLLGAEWMYRRRRGLA